jgi:hypothetical protein
MIIFHNNLILFMYLHLFRTLKIEVPITVFFFAFLANSNVWSRNNDNMHFLFADEALEDYWVIYPPVYIYIYIYNLPIYFWFHFEVLREK